EAIAFYEEFIAAEDGRPEIIEAAKLKIKMCENGIKMVKNPIDVRKIENLGKKVNSDYSDYAPLITADQNSIYFTSRRKGTTGGFIDMNGEFFADIYMTYKKNNKWYKVKNIGRMVNSDMNEMTLALSPNEQQMLVSIEDYAHLTTDIYFSPKRGRTWFKIELLGSKNEDIDTDINSRRSETGATFTPDGTTLIFSSDRKDVNALGGVDLYRAKQLPNGEWGLTINLGPTINSEYDEEFPHLHTDGTTLYFSNNGPKSMGGYDIFKSTLNEFGEWSEPENLGYPINSSDDDKHFVLTLDGKHGYFSSIRTNGYGAADLYHVRMPRPEGVSAIPNIYISFIGYPYLDTTAVDVDSIIAANYEDTLLIEKITSMVPVGTTITAYEAETNNTYGVYNSDATNGKFIMILYPNKTYRIVANVNGFETFQEVMTVEEELDANEPVLIDKKIILKRIAGNSEETDDSD
ncbi:PD40 domain-containing protein, partial [Cytophagaceae bacterium AH-315-L13]|nr:PD40 domain-containing protein [Cytophagaceae bacterium AH-315-L13]